MVPIAMRMVGSVEQTTARPDTNGEQRDVADDGLDDSSLLLPASTLTLPALHRLATDKPSSDRENRTCKRNVYRVLSSLCSCRSNICA